MTAGARIIFIREFCLHKRVWLWGSLGLLILAACAPPPRHAVRTTPMLMTDGAEHADIHPWTCAETADPAQFSFAIVADNAGGTRPGVFASAIRKLNHLRPAFVMSVGDPIEGGTQDTLELDRQWDALDGQVQLLASRFYYATGNHDLSNKTLYDRYGKRFGRPYYHFMYGGALFLVTATSDSGQDVENLSAGQIAYFRTVLQQNPAPRWTFVVMHNPLWVNEQRAQASHWPELKTLLAGRDYTVFAGHSHAYRTEVRDRMHYYTLSTTGGASSLKGPADGTFDHIMWVTLTPQGPRVANLMLDGIYSDDPAVDARWDNVMRGARRDSLLEVTIRMPPDPAFTTATAHVVLTNPDSLDLAFKLIFKPHAQVRVSPVSIDTVLAPRAAGSFTVTFTAVQPALLKDLTLIDYTWSVAAARYADQGYQYTQNGAIGLGSVHPGPQTENEKPATGSVKKKDRN